MKKDPVGEALRSLPRQEASTGFTARVLSGVADFRGRRRSMPVLPLALPASAMLLVAGIWLGVLWRGEHEAQTSRQAELEAARQEAAAIQADYQRLLELTRESPRLIHVNLAEDMDLVLDLSEWPGPGMPSAQPAVYRREQ